MESEPTQRDLSDALAGIAHLRLLVLHGSRATGTHHEGSDWDLGYLADGPIDVETLHARLTTVLGTDAVDLVDLNRASAVLRFRAARDGRPFLARPPEAWEEFVLTATRFWCDAGSVLARAHDRVLAELTP